VKKKTVVNTTIFGLATTTRFGHHGGHHQVAHTKVDKLIQYANT